MITTNNIFPFHNKILVKFLIHLSFFKKNIKENIYEINIIFTYMLLKIITNNII